MKKMLTSVLLMVVLSPVSAQIVSSQSERVIVTKEPKVKKEKKPRTMKFMLKGGIGGDFEEDNSFGYEASFGIAMPVGKKGALWMPEIGFMSRGRNSFIDLDGYKETGGKCFTLQVSLINFGWKLRVNNDISFLPVVGLYGGYSFGRSDFFDWVYKLDNKEEHSGDIGFDIGANIGLNFLIKERFLLGIQSRFGFMPRKDHIRLYDGSSYSSEYYDESHTFKKLMFTFGIMF